MTPLEARQENNKVILRAIQRREDKTAATIQRSSYAQAVQKPRYLHHFHIPSHTHENKLPTTVNPPSPHPQITPNHRINGVINKLIESTLQKPESDNNEEGLIMVKRKKNRALHKDIKSNHKRDHAWLLQQRRCFKCFLKGHQKQQCKRTIKCFQCNKEGHIYKHCNSRINGSNKKSGESTKSDTTSDKGEKPKKFTPLFAGTKQGSTSFLQQQHTWLLKEGRCLKCCLRGHTKDQCIRPSKCFICNKAGHISRQCKSNSINVKPSNQVTSPIKSHEVQQQNTHTKNREKNKMQTDGEHPELGDDGSYGSR